VSYNGSGVHFRDLFTAPAGRETVRAFALFGVLLAILVGIGSELVVRELGLQALVDRIDLGRIDAVGIAREVAQVARAGGVMDYGSLRSQRERVRERIRKRIADREFVEFVEIRDRSGNSLLFVTRDPPASVPARPSPRGDARWPQLDGETISVQFVEEGPRPSGEVRLGIAPEGLRRELEALRRSLWVQIGISGALAVGVLVLGLLYVLFLLRKNKRLEQARQSAERASYVGLLASGLAHEIRNPLNAMNMNLQMLEEELAAQAQRPDPEHLEMLESTKSEIKRLERLVNNFLTYARPTEPSFEPTDLGTLVTEVVRLLEADFRQHDVRLVSDMEPLLPPVELDETQVKQALINLLVNARQVLAGGGTVTIRTRIGSGGDAVLEVEDDGPGIPREARERIFEVFYSRRGGGTGLGLPIARQIVERHGGTIEVDDRVGGGTCFRIRLPRHHERSAAPAPAVGERV
jgi:signal transduction histidine kinase